MPAYTRTQLRIQISAYKEELLRCIIDGKANNEKLSFPFLRLPFTLRASTTTITAELYNFLYSLINNFNP